VKLFQPKEEEVTGELRKMRNKELHNLCTSPIIIRVIKWTMTRWV